MEVLPGPDAAEQTVPVFPPRGGVAFPERPGRKAGRGQVALRASETAALEVRSCAASYASMSSRR